MFPLILLEGRSGVPLYRQLYLKIKQMIDGGTVGHGERLPATRELAGVLGLNRATVSAAYDLLESEGLIRGHVGRGSFVSGRAPRRLDWGELLAGPEPHAPAPAPADAISFATSRPAEELFPVEAFRLSCDEVLSDRQAASILQLGCPGGYAPLRHYLMEEARRSDLARPGDDVIITNGCQQALDLLQRVLVRPGDTVMVEDPVYPGLKNLFTAAGVSLCGIPVTTDGLDVEALERAVHRTRPRLLVVTSDFQNPTGATLPEPARRAVLRLARTSGFIVVENDIYGELRYRGEPVPPLKRLDDSGDTVLLRSFSKITFPGLRVGWVVGPKPLLARLADAKQLADLHTDQLSQAALLRFAESGRMAAHHARVLAAGAERLAAAVAACERSLPPGATFTRPEGGMNLWVSLPEPLDSAELLPRAHREGVTYLPGKFFAVSRPEPGGLRLSFAGLAPEKIRGGLAILGQIFSTELARARRDQYEPVPAMV